jgi:hypothetical protein
MWIEVSLCLCLDVVTVIHEEMGLFLPESQRLPEIFRPGIAKINENGKIDEDIICEYKRKIKDKLGDESLQAFLVWLFSVYKGSSGWNNWKRLMEILGTYDIQEMRESSQITEEQTELLVEYIDYCFYWQMNKEDKVTRLLKKLRKSKLSTWDKAFLIDNNLQIKVEHIDLTTDRPDALLSAVRAISMRRFQLGWDSLWDNFTFIEKIKIVEFGEKRLKSPSTLGEAGFLPYQGTLYNAVYQMNNQKNIYGQQSAGTEIRDDL